MGRWHERRDVEGGNFRRDSNRMMASVKAPNRRHGALTVGTGRPELVLADSVGRNHPQTRHNHTTLGDLTHGVCLLWDEADPSPRSQLSILPICWDSLSYRHGKISKVHDKTFLIHH